METVKNATKSVTSEGDQFKKGEDDVNTSKFYVEYL